MAAWTCRGRTGPHFFQFSQPEAFIAALEATGFREVTVQPVEQAWEMEDALGLITAVMEGAVRARGVLQLQSKSARKAIADAVTRGMEPYQSPGGGYRVPMPAWVGAGSK